MRWPSGLRGGRCSTPAYTRPVCLACGRASSRPMEGDPSPNPSPDPDVCARAPRADHTYHPNPHPHPRPRPHPHPHPHPHHSPLTAHHSPVTLTCGRVPRAEHTYHPTPNPSPDPNVRARAPRAEHALAVLPSVDEPRRRDAEAGCALLGMPTLVRVGVRVRLRVRSARQRTPLNPLAPSLIPRPKAQPSSRPAVPALVAAEASLASAQRQPQCLVSVRSA